MMQILLATNNAGKLAEYQELLAGVAGLKVASLVSLRHGVDVVEDGETFHANALKKAQAAARILGLPSMADDSGLEVDALAGRPGVRSARYAGERASDAENNAKLLTELEGVPESERAARFRCTIVIVDQEGKELVLAEGTCEGRIAEAPAGTGGFGYDPVFVPEGDTRTMAELSREEKNAISHRAKASASLKAQLRELPDS